MKNVPNVVEAYKNAKNDGVAISSITLSELYYGVYNSAKLEKNSLNLINFLIGLDVLDFDENAAMEYGRIRTELRKRGKPIGSMDMLIAAHAKSRGLILATNNIREFEQIGGLALEDWVNGHNIRHTLLWSAQMNKLDYKKLQPLSANTSENKNTKANNSDICKSNIDNYIENYRNYLLDTSVYECASLLISENNWFSRKGNIKCYNNGEYLALKAKQIVQVDFGKTYTVECGLIHYALILKVLDKKIFLVPMTTNKNVIKKAYHRINNPSGDFEFRQALLSEGFPKDAALYINDIKCLSIGRVIPYSKITMIDDVTYNEIREHITRLMFSDMYKKHQHYKEKA